MILAGQKRAATCRAKRRITRMGMSAPRYQREGAPEDVCRSFWVMQPLYRVGAWAIRQNQPGPASRDVSAPMSVARRIRFTLRLNKYNLVQACINPKKGRKPTPLESRRPVVTVHED